MSPTPDPSRPPSTNTQTYDADTEEDNTPINETTLLIRKPSDHENAKSIPEPTSTARTLINEAIRQLAAALPVILSYMLQMSLQVVSVAIVGRLSPEVLSTAAFAYMFTTASGWLVALGGSTAIDTLASASFTGSKDPQELGVILQRAFVVLGGLYLPVVVVWFFSEPLFVALGYVKSSLCFSTGLSFWIWAFFSSREDANTFARQDAWLAHDAARFLWVLAPGGLGYIYFETVKKFLQAQGTAPYISHTRHRNPPILTRQGMPRASTYVLLLTSPLNALLNYLFIYIFNVGLYGAPLATGISYWLSFLLLSAYTFLTRARSSLSPLTFRAVEPRALLTFLRLALLGILHVGSEWCKSRSPISLSSSTKSCP